MLLATLIPILQMEIGRNLTAVLIGKVAGASTDYKVDDIVRDSVGTVYIKYVPHLDFDFGNDRTVSGYWDLFVVGGANVLPAISTGDQTKQLSIAEDGSTLEWVQAGYSANVFHVAPHGTDVQQTVKLLPVCVN